MGFKPKRRKFCRTCGVDDLSLFRGHSVSICNPCRHAADNQRKIEKRKEDELARAAVEARIASDVAQLKPEDFDVSVGNDPGWTKGKRQDFSENMAAYAESVRSGQLTEQEGRYIGALAEQERRFQNRKMARSVSIAAANEALQLRLFKQAAKQYLSGKVEPTGYATKKTKRSRKRTVCVVFSDLHLGADLSSRDNPLPFQARHEARRLEFITRQVLDYKPQHRNDHHLLVLLNGDIIEGNLGHDLRDGAPLTEQKVAFWIYFREIIGLFAQQYPTVHVECQPGNHGRDKMRHPGRATSSKWDGHEWQMYYALSMMCSELKNVTWGVPFRGVSILDVHGSKMLVTHGDTEVKLGDPDTKAQKNAAELEKCSSTQIHGSRFDCAVMGHFHKPRFIPGHIQQLWNGALVPPNGHARSQGYVGEPCGQWVWEAVEGYPIGDLRFLGVGHSQDEDEYLGKLIKPFRFEE